MSYKLTYFNVTGLGEVLRFLLSYGDLPFEDDRIDFLKDPKLWPTIKEKFPYGQLPVLSIDGKVVHQSTAIARYLAKQLKLAGNNDWESMEVDTVVDTIADIRTKIFLVNWEQDLERKKATLKTIFEETLPYYFTRLDAAAKSGHLVLDRLTWADLLFVSILPYFNYVAEKDVLTGYPNLQQVEKNVVSIPKIKAYLDKRPQTKM